jgi:hypothetical protein
LCGNAALWTYALFTDTFFDQGQKGSDNLLHDFGGGTPLELLDEGLTLITGEGDTVLFPTPPLPDKTTILWRIRQSRDWRVCRFENSSSLSWSWRRTAEQFVLPHESQAVFCFSGDFSS